MVAVGVWLLRRPRPTLYIFAGGVVAPDGNAYAWDSVSFYEWDDTVTVGSVEALDVSADAVARIAANAAANGITNLTAREANVFDELRHLEREGARYDTIVLDPPAFAKNKAAVQNALAGYKEINLRALRLLAPGGYLITCSCSYNVDEGMFGQAVFEASADAHIPVSVVEKRMQGRDHPILLGVPETYYLKCLILRKLA